MKTSSAILFAVSAAALATLAITPALGASLLFATGLAGIAIHDYARASRTLKLPMTMAVGTRTEKFGLAA